MSGPRSSDEGTDGDDRVGQVKERVDDDLTAFMTALESVEGVVPGIRALNVPSAAGLDRRFLALVGDTRRWGAGQTRTP